MKQKNCTGSVTDSRLFQLYRHALLIVMILREVALIAAEEASHTRRKSHAAA